MKLDGLKELVKEELKRALSENTNYTPGGFVNDAEKPWMSLPPGTYDGSGADLDVVNISQSDIDDANNFGTSSLNFWKGLIDNNLFGRGDRVMNVEKVA
jgi:hypothetical protein